MKLDKIKFAALVQLVTRQFNALGRLDLQTLELMDELIDVEVPQQEVQHNYPNVADVNNLMRLMAAGTQKIEAIKLHRTLTGWGLKESKDEVEKFWDASPMAWSKAEMRGKVPLFAHSDAELAILEKFIEGL